MKNIRQNARLENWYVGSDDLLHGTVYGHPKIPDGEIITTSRVVTLNRATGEAETKNTHYKLGIPRDLSYEQVCKERDEWISKYRHIELANAEMTRNDHVQFGKLMEERNKLKEQEKYLIQAKDQAIDLANLFKAENERLHRSIVKELSENDELGNEYTYMMVLKEEVERLKEILSYIPKVPTESYEKEMAKEIVRLTQELERAKRMLSDALEHFGEGWSGRCPRAVEGE